MTDQNRCRKCDASLSADAPSGLCPKCLLLAGFDEPAAEPVADDQASVGSPTVKSPAPGTTGFVPPSPADLAPLFPQLEILELIGKGGMGAVYKARQKGLDRLVAVKILPPEVGHDPAFAQRFTREAQAMAKLSHPHIVAIHDFGQSNGQFYFVMEYIEGANLRQVINTKQLSTAEALAMVPQICAALQYAHDEGIVHRDIKPENILVDKKGRVKIADFGLSKLLHHDQPDVSLTGTHQVMGTLRYMAPEQMQGTKGVDHRADIYSLGVVFYELLTGQVPMGRFEPPSQKVQIDVRLDEVVLRALAQEPDKRYQQASDVTTDMEALNVAHSPRPTPITEPTDEHPLLAGLRFWMTPQGPNYVRWVSKPLLLLLAAVFIINLVVAFAVPQSVEWPHLLAVVGGAVLLAGVALWLHLWWTVKGRHLTFDLQQHPLDRPAAPKPWIIPLLAFCNLLAGLFLLTGGIAGSALESSGLSDERLLEMERSVTPYASAIAVWERVSLPLYLISSAAFFVAAIGLLMYQPWARKLTIGICLFELAALAIDIPALVLGSVVPSFVLWEDPEYLELAGYDADFARMSAMIIAAFVVCFTVCMVSFLVTQLVILNRPKVVAAFQAASLEAAARRGAARTPTGTPTTGHNRSRAVN